MCGLTGFWDFKASTSTVELLTIVRSMATMIEKRGPDSYGDWCDEKTGIAFGHRRLAIVDLSSTGHQPMTSKSGRSVISYNGEIYNASEIRAKLILQGCSFRGHSDTEVILEACEHWGVEFACKQFIGMFAFSFWDKKNQILTLVRDRLGIKPLYWGFQQGILFFGSQLKSFSTHPHWNPAIDYNALASYFRFNYVPATLSIFKDIHKLSPGSLLTIDMLKNVRETRFWDFQNQVLQGTNHKDEKSDVEWIDELDFLLRDAVNRRMIADVPAGAFLSGGIDSSTVVALMQAQSKTRVKTFSIGFYEDGYDEAKYALAVANFLKTEHHELYVSSNEAQAIIPDIPNWCDEPFADVSQIPTYLVSRLAQEHVKISLSGDGGDELFAGYNRYIFGHNLWTKIKVFPFWLRSLAAKSILKLSQQTWDSFGKIIPAQVRPSLLGDKAYKFADVLKNSNQQEFYKTLVSFWENPSELVILGNETITYPWNQTASVFEKNRIFVESMQFMDTITYLPDDILTKVDRASMAVSLEARVPLLDHRIVEFSTRLPMNLKIRNNQSKWILRQVLNRYVPKNIIERPKMGFGVPIDQWLRGPLREWAENLISSDRLKQEGILNSNLIRNRWDEHLSLKRNWQYSLWGVLMFQAWKEKWRI